MQTTASGMKLQPSFTMPVGFEGTWEPPAPNSVSGAAVVAEASYWKNPPPGAGPTIIPTCVISTPTGLVWNGPTGQIPEKTPVMSPSGVFLGYLGALPASAIGEVISFPVGSAVAPTWEPLTGTPLIPCLVPGVASGGNALKIAQQMAEMNQLLIQSLM
jgi:hypothetical protein